MPYWPIHVWRIWSTGISRDLLILLSNSAPLYRVLLHESDRSFCSIFRVNAAELHVDVRLVSYLAQRSFLRKRLEMPGGEYLCNGVLGDFFEVLFCFPLTACQEARELEIRSMRRWHPMRGFRGKGASSFACSYCLLCCRCKALRCFA